MSEKVVLSKEVAEAIEELRSNGFTNSDIFIGVIDDYCTKNHNIIRMNFAGRRDELMSALVNGYEVEKTPEENLREYYERVESRRRYCNRHDAVTYYDFELSGIRTTLNYLGIKIKGVNA